MGTEEDAATAARVWQQWWDEYLEVLEMPRKTEREAVRFADVEQSTWEKRPVDRDFQGWHDALPEDERRVLDQVIADRYRVAALSDIQVL